jgi:hypothetical protein
MFASTQEAIDAHCRNGSPRANDRTVLLGDRCLKVGKAGPKSQARFTSQHYGFNAPATLAKSLLKHPNHVAALLPRSRRRELETLSATSVGAWIEHNTSRFHVFLPTGVGALALSLLEAFLQCRLQPVFEASVDTQNRPNVDT